MYRMNVAISAIALIVFILSGLAGMLGLVWWPGALVTSLVAFAVSWRAMQHAEDWYLTEVYVRASYRRY